jgi:hypothetical protein
LNRERAARLKRIMNAVEERHDEKLSNVALTWSELRRLLSAYDDLPGALLTIDEQTDALNRAEAKIARLYQRGSDTASALKDERAALRNLAELSVAVVQDGDNANARLRAALEPFAKAHRLAVQRISETPRKLVWPGDFVSPEEFAFAETVLASNKDGEPRSAPEASAPVDSVPLRARGVER